MILVSRQMWSLLLILTMGCGCSSFVQAAIFNADHYEEDETTLVTYSKCQLVGNKLTVNKSYVSLFESGLGLNLDAAGKSQLNADFECTSSCEEGSIAEKKEIRGIGEVYTKEINKEGLIKYTIENVPIATVDSLVEECSKSASGQIRYTLNSDQELRCKKEDGSTNGFYKKRVHYLEVKCVNVLPPQMAYAQVDNGIFHYSCPDTPKNDQEYWEKYRLVVEGTQSHDVRTRGFLGKLKCIRAYRSDNSNLDKIIND